MAFPRFTGDLYTVNVCVDLTCFSRNFLAGTRSRSMSSRTPASIPLHVSAVRVQLALLVECLYLCMYFTPPHTACLSRYLLTDRTDCYIVPPVLSTLNVWKTECAKPFARFTTHLRQNSWPGVVNFVNVNGDLSKLRHAPSTHRLCVLLTSISMDISPNLLNATRSLTSLFVVVGSDQVYLPDTSVILFKSRIPALNFLPSGCKCCQRSDGWFLYARFCLCENIFP